MGSQPFLIDESSMFAVQILNAEFPVSIQQRCMLPGHKNVIKRDIRIKMLALAAKHRYGFGQSYNVSTLIGVPRSTIKKEDLSIMLPPVLIMLLIVFISSLLCNCYGPAIECAPKITKMYERRINK